MRRTILMFLFLATITVHAADIYTYSVTGNVMYLHNGTWENLVKTTALEETDSLKMDKYSSVVLLDKENTPFPIQFNGVYTVRQALKKCAPVKSNKIREILSGFAREIIVSKQVSMENYNIRQGAVFRSSTASEVALASALYQDIQSAYDISFRLLYADTGEPVRRMVREDKQLILEIINRSKTPLFVNLIDSSSEGVVPVLPMDSLGLMPHLLVPAFSTVRFDDNIMKFVMVGKGTDLLVLLADTEPFDVMKVINTKKLTINNNRSVGVSKQTIDIY